VENFAKKFFALTDFKREVFVLSSGECVTATRVVQKNALLLRRCRSRVGRGVRRSEDELKGSRVALAIFFQARFATSSVTCNGDPSHTGERLRFPILLNEIEIHFHLGGCPMLPLRALFILPLMLHVTFICAQGHRELRRRHPEPDTGQRLPD
jgi:hypothetical protein